jgi:cytochrome bd-type quinol oxidase subunit 2
LFLFLVNLIAIPCCLIIATFYLFFGKEKIQSKLFYGFLVNLTVLYLCLAFCKLRSLSQRSDDNNEIFEWITSISTYLSYYSLVACFVWLYVMCHDILWKMNNLVKKRNADEKQDQWRILFYCALAIGVPLILTDAVSYYDFLRPNSSEDSIKSCIRLGQFSNIAVLMLLLAFCCGVTLFIKTYLCLRNLKKTQKDQIGNAEKIAIESSR